MKRNIIRYGFFLLLFPLLLTAGCKKKKKTPPPPQKKVAAPAKKAPAAQPAPKTRYYVITGSFLYPENEQRYEGMMRDEGFTPMQLPGDSGFQRVAVFSFDNEAEARQKLQEVRTSSPRFSDAWLLITKE
jgi:cell division protein FtsN